MPTLQFFSKASLEIAQSNDYLFGIGTANLCLSFAYSTQGHYETSLDYSNRASEIANHIS
ncbi:MAG: hypothetical protein IPP48_10915 [Chitinophagaceae bacterium]|nr:hypothetical protein [Chitinophagaceae bacterium]